MRECQYCLTYQDCPSKYRYINAEGKAIQDKRWCTKTSKYVTDVDDSCEHFERTKRFWCRRFQQWQYNMACLNSQRKRLEGCVQCTQGRTVMSVMRGVPGNGESRPTLLKRPTLIRR